LAASGTPTITYTGTGLPPGVTVSPAGLVSGTPTTAGSYTVEVTATNGTAPAATHTVTVTVAAVAAGPTPTVLHSAVSTYVAGDTQTATLTNGLTAGNYLVAVCTNSNNGVASGAPTGIAGVSWSLQGTYSNGSTVYASMTVYTGTTVGGAGVTGAITGSVSFTQSGGALWLFEVTGGGATPTVDAAFADVIGSTTTSTAPTLTLASPGDLVIAGMVGQNPYTGPPSTGYTTAGNVTAGQAAVAYSEPPSTAYSPLSWTAEGTGQWMAFAVAFKATVTTGQNTSGTTVTTPDPGGYTNPFTASVWRTAIPGSPTLSASSAAYVSRFTSDISAYYGTVGININSSCPTRYIVHGNSIPDVTVDITGNGGSYVGTVQCPIPTNAISDPNGTDHEMVIWDVDNQVVYEFWVASKSGTQWSAKTYASESTSTGDGVFARAGNTAGCSASQLSYLGAMITAEDVAAGVIDHAIACAIVSTSGGFVAPATTADGDTSGGVPEGTRFFFPSSVSMPSGLSPLAQMIFTAIKTYGMYLIDTAGAVVVYTENVSAWTNIGLSDPITPSLDGVASYEAITGFPWASMEALVAP
jgi:hypothetical protein